ncbi:alpha/beta fold hydrolase [Pedobacter sp. L105]|uniref:alpha/beta fold hydrolase n=1 Tax=Pedobacter sp. L105 TaxID=1641871 RepID=UPI00131AC750|nr:alpha/beta hydrolase [Pedobacter sp. L105]
MIRYAETELLKMAYLERGAAGNPVILLLHGWPDDATTWNGVLPKLVEKGYRVLAPWLRGFGRTTFKDKSTAKTGNAGMIALDIIEFMDSLNIAQFAVVGHDWGANIGEALAIGWPEKIIKIALLSSPPRLGSIPVPNFKHGQLQWYHWFMATKRGAAAVRKDPIGFAHIMWENWAPKGWFTEQTFEKVSESWNNPDFVEVTLHSYRSRWGEAEPDERSKYLEERIKATKSLKLPALYVQGKLDGVNPPYASEFVHERFNGPFNRIVLPGIGHFPSREAPEILAEHLVVFFQE